MMYFLKHKPFAVIVGGLLVFSACKKDSDSNAGPAPVVEPITVAAAKPNDTLTLKGQNFSSAASGNKVKIGDVEATVVSASATEIKIVIPAISTPGTYTITVTVNGKTTEVGSIVIAPLTFYVVKGDYSGNGNQMVMTINPQDGSESLVASVGPVRINDVVYFPGTNEIMGIPDDGGKMVKVNVATKNVTSVPLPWSKTSYMTELVVDKNNNLYGIKIDYTNPKQIQSLLKIDPATGNTTVIKTFEEDAEWSQLVYVPATNDIVGLMNEGKRLFKMNLTTKDTAGVILPGAANVEYRELIVDNKSDLYAYKAKYPGDGSDIAKIVKVNGITGQETLIKDLPVDGRFEDNIIFVPQMNEFIGIWDQGSIYRINATSLNITPLKLNTGYYYTYNYFTSN
jgi:hypothetical protein